ncbi:MAG: Uma2 family endonuclease [Verrucomicrobia bacterium]|jgi:Uma2 family endonuclease|nr:Uma2 family endonuclease [Verrucomicrobiota bacterium]MBT7064864.1 Uma2 family endonuclease [Verrucomicrobiota bacterium]MBT7699846.1 Uma2 family endonuclease [Verrucomicrobiota bacterium]
MGQAALKREGRYTWTDYRTWPADEQWELIGGEAFDMSPAPGTRHQTVVTELGRQFGNHFQGKPCKVFVAPTDVKLSEADIVQPDLIVVCDENRIKPTHIEGPPTLVIEVLSPSTQAYDRVRKLRLFAASGVQEVWLVTPYPSLVEVLMLDGASYRIAGGYTRDETPVSVAFPELQIDPTALFDFPLTPEDAIQRVKEDHAPYGNPAVAAETN